MQRLWSMFLIIVEWLVEQPTEIEKIFCSFVTYKIMKTFIALIMSHKLSHGVEVSTLHDAMQWLEKTEFKSHIDLAHGWDF